MHIGMLGSMVNRTYDTTGVGRILKTLFTFKISALLMTFWQAGAVEQHDAFLGGVEHYHKQLSRLEHMPMQRSLLQYSTQVEMSRKAQVVASDFTNRYYGSPKNEQEQALWNLLTSSWINITAACQVGNSTTKPVVQIIMELIYVTAGVTELVERSTDSPAVYNISYAPPFKSEADILINYYYIKQLPYLSRVRDWIPTIDVEDGSTTTPPPQFTFTNMPLLLYFRVDVFRQHNLSIPATWNQLINLAARYNSTDINGDGVPEYSLCLNQAFSCRSSFLLMAIVASMTQTRTSEGFILNPADLAPKLPDEVITAALQIYASLAKYSNPAANARCGWGDRLFATGHCLMTINFDQFRSSPESSPSTFGQMGVALLPGSERIYDASAGTLVDCTPQLCPNDAYMTPVPVRRTADSDLAAKQSATSTIDATQPSNQSASDMAATSTGSKGSTTSAATMSVPINRPPFATMATVVFAMDSSVDAQAYQAITATWTPLLRGDAAWYRLLGTGMASLSSITTDAQAVLALAVTGPQTSANTTDLMYTAATVDKVNQVAVARVLLTSQGKEVVKNFGSLFHEQDAVRYLLALGAARLRPNIALDMQQAGASYFRLVYAEAARNYTTGGMASDQIVAAMRSKMQMILTRVGNTSSFRQLYATNIGWQPPPPAPPASPVWRAAPATIQQAPRESGNTREIITIAVSVGVPVLVVLLLAALWMVKRPRHRGLLGGLRAPGVGPSTTLVVTDIQNSTVLWESLPAAAMDQAVRLHHSVLRSAAAKNDGYESATEGDSFILAFHSSQDALLFCLEAQQLLLDSSWPVELEESGLPDCASLRVVPKRTGAPHLSSIVEKVVYTVENAALGASFTSAASEHSQSITDALFKLRALSTTLQRSFLSPLVPAHSTKPPSLEMNAVPVFNTQGWNHLLLSRASSVTRMRRASSVETPDRIYAADCPVPTAEPRTLLVAADGTVALGTSTEHSQQQSADSGDLCGSPSLQMNASAEPGLPARATATLPESPGPCEDALSDSPGCESTHRQPRSKSATSTGGLSFTVPGWRGDFKDEAAQVRSSNLGMLLASSWQPYQPEQHGEDPVAAGAILVFRGLRVRMGLHTGLLSPAHVAYHRDSGRTQYSGSFAATAKAVCDAAHGGMTLMSDAVFGQLQMQQVWDRAVVVDMGQHLLADSTTPVKLYQALPRTLVARLGQLRPLRSAKQVCNGVSSAPVGNVAIAFMHVTCMDALRSWNPEVAAEAVQLYEHLAREQVEAQGGYVVELKDGLCLGAFPHPAVAVVWALQCQKVLLHADWPAELLRHELCEEIALPAVDVNGRMQREVCSRGLRIKVGIDFGPTIDSIHGSTGAVAYRGKVMNRAARIGGLATTGQVLCSGGAWQLAKVHPDLRAAAVVADSLGLFQMKGLLEQLEVLQCSLPRGLITTHSARDPGHVHLQLTELTRHARQQCGMTEAAAGDDPEAGSGWCPDI